ncbi:MAG: hypothetical protein QNK11_00030 [Legionella sp.]|nr:hypothetical protein [Legionella sp.]
MPKLYVLHSSLSFHSRESSGNYQPGDYILTLSVIENASSNLFILKKKPASPSLYLGLDKNYDPVERIPQLPLTLLLIGQRKNIPDKMQITSETYLDLKQARETDRAIECSETDMESVCNLFTARTSPSWSQSQYTFYQKNSGAEAAESDLNDSKPTSPK